MLYMKPFIPFTNDESPRHWGCLSTDIQFRAQLKSNTGCFLQLVAHLLNDVLLTNLWEGDFSLLSPLFAQVLIKHML